jgi:uncharacterized membrane protein HdeD (DUF308 family)
MDTLLARRWWAFPIRALTAALFGSAVLAQHGLVLSDFSRWFGIAAVVNGLFALGATVVSFDAGNPWGDPGWDGTPTFAVDPAWRGLVAEGVVSFVTGVVVLVTPITSDRALFGLIAALAFATAIAQALTAGQLQRLAAGWQAMTSAAVVSFSTGLTLILTASSGATATARMTVVAVAALIEAAILVAIGAALRRLARAPATPSRTTVLAADLVISDTANAQFAPVEIVAGATTKRRHR